LEIFTVVDIGIEAWAKCFLGTHQWKILRSVGTKTFYTGTLLNS